MNYKFRRSELYLLFIYPASYGIKIILSLHLLDYESVCSLNFLRIQLSGLIDISLYLAYGGEPGYYYSIL